MMVSEMSHAEGHKKSQGHLTDREHVGLECGWDRVVSNGPPQGSTAEIWPQRWRWAVKAGGHSTPSQELCLSCSELSSPQPAGIRWNILSPRLSRIQTVRNSSNNGQALLESPDYLRKATRTGRNCIHYSDLWVWAAHSKSVGGLGLFPHKLDTDPPRFLSSTDSN